MKLNFRQGVVDYPTAPGLGQQFLFVNGSVVDLRTNNGPTTISFAHKTRDYLLSEGLNVSGAWGPFTSTPAWLYWDIDRSTGLRTFGHTVVAPITSNTAPTSPVANQHWFDTTTNTMKVYTSNVWVEKIRVFAAMLNGTNLTPLGSNTRKPFAGSQVGLTNITSFSGAILFDESGNPVQRSSDGTFYTTETEFFNGSTRVNGVRLESDTISGVLLQNIAAYSVVKVVTNGQLQLASYNDVGSSVVGITTQDGMLNDAVNIILQGVVTNGSWNWQIVGQQLFVESNGELTGQDPHLSNPTLFPTPQVPVARVLGPKQIIFMQGLGGVGPRGPVGSIDNLPPATDVDLGAVYLSVPAEDENIPLVFGTNDPLLAGAPFTPLTHTTDTTAHAATDITITPAGNVTTTDVESAIYELDLLIGTSIATRLPIAGGTLTGNLTLVGDPSSNLHAATKQYVDNLTDDYLPLIGGTLTGNLTLVGDPSSNLHAATKQYVDQFRDYDLSVFYPGTLADASEMIYVYPSTTTFRITAGGASCEAYTVTLATVNSNFDVRVNGISVGTVTFTTASNVGTFTIPSDIVVTPGDILTIIGPLVADATLANFAITLKGVRE